MSTKASLAVFVAICLVLVAAGAVAAQHATPIGGDWCGMTSDGGSVRMTLTSDGRWLTDIDIRTKSGTASSGETSRGKTQIVDGKFIFRSGTESAGSGSSGRCEKPPCRGTVAPTSSATIRGTFRASDSMRGSYTGLTSATTPSGSRAGTVRRHNGTFVAWPAGLAPCP